MKRNLIKGLVFGLTAFAGFCAIGPQTEANSALGYGTLNVNPAGNSDIAIRDSRVFDINDYAEYVNATWKRDSRYMPYYNPKFPCLKVAGYTYYVVDSDPITAFVDEECFYEPGDYILMGSEYGYYAHTEKIRANEYTTDLLLLNFSFSNNNAIPYEYHYKVEVVSQCKYFTAPYYILKSGYSNQIFKMPDGSDGHIVYMKADDSAKPSDNGEMMVVPVMNHYLAGTSNFKICQYDNLFLVNNSLTGLIDVANDNGTDLTINSVGLNAVYERMQVKEHYYTSTDKAAVVFKEVGKTLLDEVADKVADTYGPIASVSKTIAETAYNIFLECEKLDNNSGKIASFENGFNIDKVFDGNKNGKYEQTGFTSLLENVYDDFCIRNGVERLAFSYPAIRKSGQFFDFVIKINMDDSVRNNAELSDKIGLLFHTSYSFNPCRIYDRSNLKFDFVQSKDIKYLGIDGEENKGVSYSCNNILDDNLNGVNRLVYLGTTKDSKYVSRGRVLTASAGKSNIYYIYSTYKGDYQLTFNSENHKYEELNIKVWNPKTGELIYLGTKSNGASLFLTNLEKTTFYNIEITLDPSKNENKKRIIKVFKVQSIVRKVICN